MKPYFIDQKERKKIEPIQSIVNRMTPQILKRYGIRELGSGRKQPQCEARQVLMYLLSKEHKKVDVARFLHVDHSTVIHAERVIGGYIMIYDEYKWINEL